MINSGTKDEVVAAINMTSVFVYQASVALVKNTDSGSHNYYMSKQPGSPWRIINVDPDWSWGHGNTCGRDGGAARLSSSGRICDQSACLALPFRDETATEVEPNRYCCGRGPQCTEGYTLVDGEGTPGAESCYRTYFRICCVQDGPAPPPPPPLAPDEEIVHRHKIDDGGVCPYDLESSDALHGAQNNEFLSNRGAMPRHFREEYFRFFQEMMAMPEYQACAVADAAAVLLDAESGVIRAAYDEDRAFWSRPIDADGADGELAFIVRQIQHS